MGAIGSKLSQPFRNWNIESRAHKIISQPKPRVAPTYESTQKQIALVNQLEPDYAEKAQKKDQQLDDYLKKVYVTSNSTETQEIEQRSDPDRPLPKDKLLSSGFEYGFYEPSEIKSGRVSLRQAIEFLANHKEDPEKYNAESIAAQYKLDKVVVENILENYKIFTVYNRIEDHNQETVISHIPISLKTGIQVRYPDDDNEKDETIENFNEALREARQIKSIENEQKKLS